MRGVRLLGLLPLLAACSSSTPPEKPPTAASSTSPFRLGRPTLVPHLPPRTVPYDKPPDDPRAFEMLRDNMSTDPAALDQAPAPDLTKAALEDTARSEARGLELVDTVHVAELDEKRRAELSVDVARGDCVTVIAHGGLGVMEVDAFLAEHKTNPPDVLAQDSREGPIAVIGGQRGCYPFLRKTPATLDVIVQARKGSGPVVFAVYRARP
jgi:hypothetical protein